MASLGQEVTVTGAAPKWYKVVMGETTGYIARSFLSKDKESADALIDGRAVHIDGSSKGKNEGAHAPGYTQPLRRLHRKGKGCCRTG